jgi:hypothetical protein
MSRMQSGPRSLLAASFAAALAAIVCAAPTASAQTQSDIVVTAASREQAQAFVSQIAITPVSADQMGRWHNDVCIGVAGLPARQGQFIADRVAQRAYALGLEPGETGCAPNISIVVAPDGNAMAQQMFAQDESLFAYRNETGVATLGHEAFDKFLNVERPVRWWHVTRAMSADGEALATNGATPGMMGGFDGARTVRSNGSMLRSTTRQDFSRVVIIIDARNAGSVPLAALSDYVAMVALAQIDPEADASAYPTILNLFDARGGSAPAAMTAWDTAYLQGLYASSRDAPSSTAQEAEIARRMMGGGRQS